MMSASSHVKKVIKRDLCCGCGLCVGVCSKNALKIENGRVTLTANADDCIHCGLCEQCCPAYGYEIGNHLGNLDNAYETYSCDEQVLENSASAGTITQILRTYIRNKWADYVLVVMNSDSIEGELTESFLVNDEERIIEAQQSKYIQASIGHAVRYLVENDVKTVVVGTPCQMYGLTMAMKHLKMLNDRIVLRIGVFCGYTYRQECISALAATMNVKKQDIDHIKGWRDGGMPGNFSVVLKNGETKSIPFHIEHSVDVTYYAQNRCKLCKDCFCEYADIVAGDIGRGWSDRKTFVLTRTQKGTNVVEQCSELGMIRAKVLSQEEIDGTNTKFMEAEKRSKVSIRINHELKLGKKVPKWSYFEEPYITAAEINATKKTIKFQDWANLHNDRILANPTFMIKNGELRYYKYTKNFAFKIWNLGCVAINRIGMITEGYSLASVGKKMISKVSRVKKNKEVIQVAVLGLGNWGLQYIPLLQSSPYYNINVIFDANLKQAQIVSERYNIPYAKTIDEVFKTSGVEAVFILTPNHVHKSCVELAAKHGKHVFLEKPIAVTHVDAKDMCRFMEEQHLKFYVAHSIKLGKEFQIMKAVIDNGGIGEPQMYFGNRSLYMQNIYKKSWRGNAELTPLLPVIQLGVHMIDVALYLFGDVQKVTTESLNKTNNAKIVKCASMQFEHSNVIGCIQCSCLTENTFTFVVYGTNGKLETDGKQLLQYSSSSKRVLCKNADKVNVLGKELEEFYMWIRDDVTPKNTGENARRVIEVFDRICNQ
jgi:coenzyme F420 hydrogenase subunit beta